MNRFWVFLVVVVGAVLDSAHSFECPDKEKGQYSHPTQCDKYYVCSKGKARERLCPDGLVFDEGIRLEVKCDQQFNVDCGNRTELQEAKGTNENCPRRNGFFPHPDSSICDVYFNCIEDSPSEMKCTAGLHFDEETANCVWPASANREGCISAEDRIEEKPDSGAFKCPNKSVKDANGLPVPHPQYAHPNDCQKFYLCINGNEKRELSCDEGKVYNEASGKCDAPKNVEECADWYADSE